MLEDANEMLGTRARLVPVAGVEGGLAATGLIFRIIDSVPKPAQHFDRVDGHLR
jgi:hypothetical protein